MDGAVVEKSNEVAGQTQRPAPTEKIDSLKQLIRSYGRALVAFSGGADSAFVLKICREALGPENVTAVIAQSPSLPQSELEAAQRIAGEIGVELLVIRTRELENPEYAQNSTRRCYFCKSELYFHLMAMAKEKEGDSVGHPPVIVNGINRDDLLDWRPGLEAAREYGVKSPLVEAGFGKEEIRFYSHELGLSTWSKPAAACLSSRIPFGTTVTRERLRHIEEGEEVLKALGFRIVRLRWRDQKGASCALIEVGRDEVGIFFQNREIRESAALRLKQIGFASIDLELAGYRPGRFNPQAFVISET